VVFAVDPEVCVVLTLDQEVTSLVTVSAPWLHRERLVLVLGVTDLLVRIPDLCGDFVGRG
jgi:hypothetical protein